MLPKITYSSSNKTIVNEDPKASLLDIAIKNKIPHMQECGGKGKCTTCRIRILEGQENLSKPTRGERKIASSRQWDPSIRLACQCFAKGNVKIQQLLWLRSQISHLQLEPIKEKKAEERAIAILFCDLRNFTGITANNLSFDMAHMLDRFYTELGEPILRNNGIIYQYVGDEIVGIFGVSGGTKQQNCKDALRAAMGMHYAIERLNNTEFKDFDTNFNIGIGINFGKAYVGYLGHPSHRQFTIVGDAINVASRIQGYTKETKSRILIAGAVQKAFKNKELDTPKKHKVILRGKEKAMHLYEFKGFTKLDINLELQASLDYLLKREEELAQKFYKNLFTVAPQLRALFQADMEAQGKIMTHMLVGIIYSLSRPSHLTTGLARLGKSHEGYGVKAEHYAVVIEVLVDTIKELLGEQFSGRVEEAWRSALCVVTEKMKNWKS